MWQLEVLIPSEALQRRGEWTNLAQTAGARWTIHTFEELRPIEEQLLCRNTEVTLEVVPEPIGDGPEDGKRP